MSYLDKYNAWINHPKLDENLKKELESLSEKEKEDAFFKDIEFGTGGMRGVMGAGSNRLNIHTIRKATQGFANYLNKNHLDGVAIGYDNRFNSKEYALDSAKLLASNNIKVYLFEYLRPTPELSFAVRYYQCAGGIMITASHNPKQYNGYKLYDETGCQLVPTAAKKVIDEINNIEDMLSIEPKKDYNQELIVNIDKEVDEAYFNAVLNIQKRSSLKKTIKIAYSPEHGASYVPVMETLKRAGYDVSDVKEQAYPDPAFSNTKSPNPEEPSSYELVEKLAKEINADLFLVCDPDGDRMGVGVKHQDAYTILSGNQTGAVLLEYILMSNQELNTMPKNPVMENTIVTSDIGKALATYYNVETEQSLTGFKYIGDKIHLHEIKQDKNYVFGYEESYGSLITPIVRDKDATQACLMLAEAVNYYATKNQTLVDVLNVIYQKVGAYADGQLSVMLPGADGSIKLKVIMEKLRKQPIALDGYQILKIEDYKLKTTTYQDGHSESLEGFDESDVLKYFLDDGSFICIRPSGTEPKCKVYLSVKDKTYEAAIKKMESFKSFVKSVLD